MRRVWASVAILATFALSGWLVYRLWPRPLQVHPIAWTPVVERVGERDVVTLPNRFFVAELGRYEDELFAYLMFQYLRGAPDLKEAEILLTYRRSGGGLTYAIEALLDNDLTAALPVLVNGQSKGLYSEFGWRYVNEETLNRFRYRTHVFDQAYNLPARHKIEDMTRAQLVAYVRRFVRFKSAVDPRIRGRIEPVPQALTEPEANQLAIDIVTVADFYSLPLEFFLGIGAMENNYMNVEGDLQHTIWKKKAERGDVVVRRRPGRVLVRNPAQGVWQITRETLRYVHRLYLADDRDYSKLPERLRPPKELDVDNPEPEVLTTYAGLLFRDLLDQFDGDVANAVGAYNGGVRNPNRRYEEGVRTVADYARQVMQQAAVLQGQPAARMRFMSSGR